MKLQRYLIPLFLFVLVCQPAPAQTAAEDSLSPDRIEVSGGVVLTGTIKSVDSQFLTLTTDYAGVLTIDINKILNVRSTRLLDFDFPEELVVMGSTSQGVRSAPKVEPEPAPKPVVAEKEQPRKTTKEEPNRGTPVDKRGWTLEAGLDFNSRSGNTEKLDLTFTAEAKLQRQFDRFDLYSRYSYGENKGSVSSDEFIAGGRYTNFFYEDIGFFVREEYELDEFEGLEYRSTTAAGISWKVRNREDLRIEARSGLSYRYEDYKDDGTRDFPGMDLGVDINWKINPWIRFKGSYTFLPSVEELEDYVVEQDSGIDMPLDMSKRWKLRLGMSAKYNNAPDQGRERLDTRYYARVIALWP